MKFQAEIIPAPQTDVLRYTNRLFIATSVAEAKTQND